MIVARIELWPGGNPANAEHLGTVVIANDGTGGATAATCHHTRPLDASTTFPCRECRQRWGNYDVILTKMGKTGDVPRSRWGFQAAKGGAWITGRVEGFPREQLGGFDLVYRALKATVGDRNP